MRPTRRRNSPKGSPPSPLRGFGAASPPLNALGAVGGAARRLDEQLLQHEPEQDAEAAKDDEGEPPAVVLSDQPGEEPAADGADVDAGLVDAHRARARPAVVIVADQRHRRRVVERLAEALGGAPEEQMLEIPRGDGGDADRAPRVESAEDRALAAHAIDHHAGDRRGEAIDPGERRSEQPELHRRQPHLLLEQREDREDGLSVGVVEERDTPQHGDDPPFVVCREARRSVDARGAGRHLIHRLLPVSRAPRASGSATSQASTSREY